MTDAQKRQFTRLLLRDIGYFVHGDCVGADADAHEVARSIGVWTELRPCNLRSQRAFCQEADHTWPVKPPLERNRDIVNSVDVMFACPSGFEEEQRSGTWATMRYARKHNRVLVIIWPDGTLGINW